MTEDTLRSDTIITDILDNDISTALERLSILSNKTSSGDVSNENSEHLSNNITDIFKPINNFSDCSYRLSQSQRLQM